RHPIELLAVEELPLREIGIIEDRGLLRVNRALALQHLERVGEAGLRRRIRRPEVGHRAIERLLELVRAALDERLRTAQPFHRSKLRIAGLRALQCGLVERHRRLGIAGAGELVGAVEQRLDARRMRRRSHAASTSRSLSKRAWATWIASTFSSAQVARPQIGF